MTKKKKKKKKKFGQAKVTDVGLEGFVDLTNSTVSESTEERESEMSGLIAGFSMQRCKRATNAQEETTLSLEVLGDKRSKPSRFDEEV